MSPQPQRRINRIAPELALLVLVAAGLVAAALLLDNTNPDPADPGNRNNDFFSNTATLRPDVRFREQLRRNDIPAIDNPDFHSANASPYPPEQLVIGLEINGDARAYSVPLLSRHEIVNDVVGGVPVAVTWCPLCFSAIVYERTVGVDVLEFEVSGLLLNNNLVMVDRQTDSLWPQSLGEAVQGPLSGRRLTFRSSVITTWDAWRSEFPTTQAIINNGSRVDGYASYYNDDSIGVSGFADFDTRLPGKRFVYGIAVGTDPSTGEAASTAYPFAVLARDEVVNDVVGGVPVVVFYAPEGDSALAFERTLPDGTTLHFAPQATEDGTVIVDTQSGSVWDRWRGVALEGPLTGTLLPRVRGLRLFWFHWRDLHPNTTLAE